MQKNKKKSTIKKYVKCLVQAFLADRKMNFKTGKM